METITNPFTRSGRIPRSPTDGGRKHPKAREHAGSAANEESVTPCSATEVVGEDPIANGLAKLEAPIAALREYVKDRHNVHHEIKRLISVATLAFCGLARELKTKKRTGEKEGPVSALSRKDMSTQTVNTTFLQAARETSKRARDHNEKKTPPAKRKVQQPLKTLELGESPRGAIANGPSPNKRPRLALLQNAAETPWTKVATRAKKSKKPKEKVVRPKPDAIVIAKTGKLSYADIIRQMKQEVNLAGFGENVARVRRTAKGEVLLQLKHGTSQTTQQLKDEFDKIFASHTETRTLTQERQVEIKDLDEVTTAEEVSAAIQTYLGAEIPTNVNVKSLRRAYAGTQRAVVSLPALQASKLTRDGKLKVGWVFCRVREKISPTRCYKGLEFGHKASHCSNTDRSGLCMKCGKQGHKAKDCRADPKCFLCAAKNRKDTTHQAGSWKCPSFTEAIKGMRV